MAPDDPHLPEFQALAGPAEFALLVPLARRFLRAAGTDDDLPDGEALIEGVYPLAAAAYLARGRDDAVFRAAMGIILDPDDLSSVIDAWRLAGGLGADGIAALLEAYRRHLGPG